MIYSNSRISILHRFVITRKSILIPWKRKVKKSGNSGWASMVVSCQGGYTAIDRGERKRRSSPRLGRNLIKDSIGAGAVRSGQYKINMCDGQRCSTFRPFSRSSSFNASTPPYTPLVSRSGGSSQRRRGRAFGTRACCRVIDFFDSGRTKGTL